MHWPFAVGSTPHDKLAEALLDTAQLHAHRAIRLSLGTPNVMESLDQAISIGASVELLAKYVLATKTPHLVMLKSSGPESVLAFSGVPPTNASLLSVVKSVSGQDALTSLTTITNFSVTKDAKESIFRVRDSAVHMGLVDPAEVEVALQSLVSVSEKLLKIDDVVSVQTYWGDELVDIVTFIKEKREKEVEARYQRLLVAAKTRFTVRGRDLPRGAILMMERLHEGTTDGQTLASLDCPACTHRATLIYNIERGDVEFDDSDAPESMSYNVPVWAVPAYFKCNVCDLVLDTEEMLEQAGMDARVRMDDDPATPEEVELYTDREITRRIESGYYDY